MLVELKNGETLNGHLVTCDTWMNLTLKEVVQTSPVCSPRLASLLDVSWHMPRGNKHIEPISLRCHKMEACALGTMLTTMQEGDKFFRLAEVYVKGNNVSLASPHLQAHNTS